MELINTKTVYENICKTCREAEEDSIYNPNWTYSVYLMADGSVRTDENYGNSFSRWTIEKDCVHVASYRNDFDPEDYWDNDHDLLRDFAVNNEYDKEFEKKREEDEDFADRWEEDEMLEWVRDEYWKEYSGYVLDEYMSNNENWESDWLDIRYDENSITIDMKYPVVDGEFDFHPEEIEMD